MNVTIPTTIKVSIRGKGWTTTTYPTWMDAVAALECALGSPEVLAAHMCGG